MLPRFIPDDYGPEKLRELALWYREQAEKTENPAIWDSRLRTAESFEEAAMQIESSSRRPYLVAITPTRDAHSDARLQRTQETVLTPAA